MTKHLCHYVANHSIYYGSERHNSVVGVELSEIAAISFFEEQGLNLPKQSEVNIRFSRMMEFKYYAETFLKYPRLNLVFLT